MTGAAVPFDQGERQARRGRHLAWLLRDGNGQRLAAGAPGCWRQYGRGFWLVSHTSEVRLDEDDAIQPVRYVGRAALATLPPGPARRDIARLVDGYDPRWQFVLVIAEPDGFSAYRLGFVDGAPR